MIEKRWDVGFKDRGMGRGDFAVIVAGTEELVVKTASLELADHIVEIHNTKLDRSGVDESNVLDFRERAAEARRILKEGEDTW